MSNQYEEISLSWHLRRSKHHIQTYLQTRWKNKIWFQGLRLTSWWNVNDETLVVGGVCILDKCYKSTSRKKSLISDNHKINIDTGMKIENKSLWNIMSYRELFLHSQEFRLSNPNPFQCWLLMHQTARDGELSFCVTTKVEIERHILNGNVEMFSTQTKSIL